MELSKLTVEIRPRGENESIDLGMRLARANARPLWGAFAVVFLAVAACVCWLFSDAPLLAAAVIWWLKPWFDRVALDVLSRAVFGDTPGVMETLRRVPRLFRRGAFASLLHLRFDAARSLNLAVWQLEQLSGSDWHPRVALIEATVRRTAGWLTACCIAFESMLMVALGALAVSLVPPPLFDSLSAWWWSFMQSDLAISWISVAAWLFAVCVIEPLYVAGGFGLYLNRRTELESWDVEIAFRRMVQTRLDQNAVTAPQ